jgi:hypothetical protein
MGMYFFVNYKEDQGCVIEIRAYVVEGDHDWPEQVFKGPDAVEQLRAWAAQHPFVAGFSTRNFLDPEEMERVRKMLKGAST